MISRRTRVMRRIFWGRVIVEAYYDVDAANAASAEFKNRFKGGELPSGY